MGLLAWIKSSLACSCWGLSSSFPKAWSSPCPDSGQESGLFVEDETCLFLEKNKWWLWQRVVSRRKDKAMSLIEVHNVSKSFGGLHALDGCSLSVEEGSIAGLIGPNGSGKTTLFNVMTGYERLDAGTILYRQETITDLPPEKIFRLGIGRTFQLTRIFPRLTVMENMHIA